ncbi:MAG: asparagine synthase (glutamine-hydrolyzing) [Anaerolineaceae bacterium]|nr:asparagine synthase (glutamine-hydrolyzing) [Anaerolineaceae bacterium]
MCGIAGILNLTPQEPVRIEYLRQMLALIRHRGPDQFGIYYDEQVGLGNARLSIIDLSSGQQPISNEDETIWIVFNGEIFNYIELRAVLLERGHDFRTQSDTEVLVHMYEEFGPRCLEQLNGQFSFAIWDSRKQVLLLARDRLGVRPLFYTQNADRLVFASEIKAILAHPAIQAELDSQALHEIFTFWAPLGGHTVFKGIQQVQPGHYLLYENGKISEQSYWQLKFPPEVAQSQASRTFADYLEQFRELLIDATQIRLRADVPVGAYLSGGLDSSTLAAIIQNYTNNRLDTFSITFSDPAFDESAFQQQMADFLGTDHHIIHTSNAVIGQVFPDVIWHTEIPVLRTSPAPMFLLSKLVHDHNFKVIMTGEGADEFLAGYDIFKEERIRRFWAEEPDSLKRSKLLAKLYPDIQALAQTSRTFLTEFFRRGLLETNRPDYSHMLRWYNTSRTLRFFSDEQRQTAPDWEQRLESHGEALGIPFPEGFMHWHPLHRAQYLEITIFLSGYLLSSQGDRVAMAHSVEGRYPFLDYRVVEFCNQLPPGFKLRGLTEKYILKQLASKWIPAEIRKRPKRPYRAPIQSCFFPENEPTPDYVEDLLSPNQIKAAGYFNPAAVNYLVRKAKQGSKLGETDNMALAGILSTQLVHQAFVSDFRMSQPLSSADDLKICTKTGK